MAKTFLVNLRLTLAEKAIWHQNAKSEGMTLSDWIKERVRDEGIVAASQSPHKAPGCDATRGESTHQPLQETVVAAPSKERSADPPVARPVNDVGAVRDNARVVVPQPARRPGELRSFTPSPGCSSPRCARLKMALCPACMKEKKQA